MGLDVFIEREGMEDLPSEDIAAFEALGDLPLMNWDVGDTFIAFRGRPYTDFVLELCHQSLFREWIPPEEVAEMAKAIEDLDYTSQEVQDLLEATEVSEAEARALGQIFRLCAERGLGLHGSWLKVKGDGPSRICRGQSF